MSITALAAESPTLPAPLETVARLDNVTKVPCPQADELEVLAQRRALEECADAEWTGIIAAGLGMLIQLVLALVWQNFHPDRLSIGLVFLIVAGGVLAIPVGVGSGWLAHAWFYRTSIPARWMVYPFTSIGLLTLFGWAIVLAYIS